MTYDEAIEIEKKKLNKIMVGSVNHIAAANIDALIELGLLKVDEPKILCPPALCEAIHRDEIFRSIAPNDVARVIAKSGYKLVKS